MADRSPTPVLAETVWDRFRAVGFTPDFGPELSRLLIELYRMLALEGRAITPDEVEDRAESSDVAPELARVFVEKTGERDDNGAVTGIVGLSLNEHPHKFLVHGNALTTWCALDPMLIAPTMTEAVDVESEDPRSGDPIRVSVTPSGVESYEPTTAVVSIVVPESGATDSLESVWGMFCREVHFFTSRESGERHFSGRDIEVYFLTIEEAFELGQLAFGPIFAQQ